MNTKKKRISSREIKQSDEGIKVSELIKLLNPSHPITQDLLNELKIEAIKDELIPIKGAETLCNAQIEMVKLYDKIDLLSKLKDISFYEGENFSFNFNNINDSLNFPGVNIISAFPIYSAQRDFFGNLFNMDRYAKNLIDNKQKNIVNKNLELLKDVKKIEKRYRLLFNKNDKKYYLRAIVSKV